MREGFAKSPDGIEIQFLENVGFDPSLAPIVFVPGMMGTAEIHQQELTDLLPRRAISFTHRGLGKSQKIQSGQATFEKRASDTSTVVRHLGLDRYFLYGFSRGVSLAVAHALQHAAEVRGLILHDCDASYVKCSERWTDMLIKANLPHAPAETIMAYARDSQAVDLNPQLKELTCPTLIFMGEKEGSLLPPQKAEAMKTLLRKSEVISLPHSAHALDDEDRAHFLSHLRRFAQDNS